MRWISAAAPSILLAVVFTVSASAKGPLDVCGQSACARLAADVHPQAVLEAETEIHSLPVAAPAPYYELRFHGATRPFGYWVPGAKILRLLDSFSSGAWFWVATGQEDSVSLSEAASGLKPFAPPMAARAWVDGREVRVARGYLDLFSLGTPVTVWPGAKGWLNVYVTSLQASPWTDSADSLFVSRRGAFLKRDGRVLRIPSAIARKVRGRLPLRG